MDLPKIWHSGENLVSPPDVLSQLILKKRAAAAGLENCDKIFVGCDSKYFKEYVLYAYAICFRGPMGINYFWSREKKRGQGRDLYSRIWGEVERAVSVSNWINENIEKINIEVHADINSNPIYASNLYNKAASGYIIGCGYSYRCKPEAWAATSVADWYTR